MELIYLNQTEQKIPEAWFQWVLDRVPLHVPEATHEDVELLLTDNEAIHVLNKTYRGKDAPTDVLSFGFEDPVHLGQIVISVERAAQQAQEIGHSLEEELKFLFCHGVLHNLGYDHENPEDEAQMLQKAYAILGRV